MSRTRTPRKGLKVLRQLRDGERPPRSPRKGRIKDPIERAVTNHRTARARALRAGAYVNDDEAPAIIGVYLLAHRLTAETGIPHEVDHKLAISEGGGHVLSNLQVLPVEEHKMKTSLERGTYWLAPLPDRETP